MAMDFPASPTDGQIANGYVWNAAQGMWLGGPAGGGSIISASDTPPGSPLQNQFWFETDTGATWFYYVDPSGPPGQWLQINAPPTGNWLPLTGGTLSGDLTISNTANALLALNKGASGAANLLRGNKAGVYRWAVVLGDATAESGSNVGSDFGINSYNDAGAFTGANLTINRATGVVTATGLPPIPKSTASALGEWKVFSSTIGGAAILPAGGSWAWFGLSVNASTGATNGYAYGGIAAGGTTVLGAGANLIENVLCWRIA
jgi:hypothetical protein